MNVSKKTIAAVVAAAVIACGATLFIINAVNKSGPVTSYDDKVYELEDEQTPLASDASVEAGIEIPGYSTIPITAGSTTAAVDIYNPENNNVYFQVSFILTDTDEQIYQSKLISPGQHLYSIDLNRALEAGDYNLTVQYDTFSTDGEYTPKNGASVSCFLSVQ